MVRTWRRWRLPTAMATASAAGGGAATALAIATGGSGDAGSRLEPPARRMRRPAPRPRTALWPKPSRRPSDRAERPNQQRRRALLTSRFSRRRPLRPVAQQPPMRSRRPAAQDRPLTIRGRLPTRFPSALQIARTRRRSSVRRTKSRTLCWDRTTRSSAQPFSAQIMHLTAVARATLTARPRHSTSFTAAMCCSA